MKCLEPQTAPIAKPSTPIFCPKMPDNLPAAKTQAGDCLKFGVGVQPGQGCCVEKLKLGRQGGCCKHIPNEQFVERFKSAVQQQTEETGVAPKLDAHLKAILDGKIKSGDPFVESSAALKPPKEPLLKRIILAPYRFVKWLWIGFWLDMKLLFNPDEASNKKKTKSEP